MARNSKTIFFMLSVFLFSVLQFTAIGVIRQLADGQDRSFELELYRLARGAEVVVFLGFVHNTFFI